jgi:methionyl-tRNA formyltransferase
MRIVYMGTPEFAVPALRRLAARHEIAAVITAPDRPAGRGRKLTASPVKLAALEMGLTVWQPESLKGEDMARQLAAAGPEVIVLAAYGRLLPPAVLAVPPYGCINLHPSLLPKYRGASPVVAQILAGDDFGGVSIMRMDAGLDTGPVMAQAQLPIMDYDDTPRLTGKMALLGAHLLAETLVLLPRGETKPRPQDDAAASYSAAVDRDAGKIDWNLPAIILARQVRAYRPWPGSYTRWQGKRLEILAAGALDSAVGVSPGTVIAHPGAKTRGGFRVQTGAGLLAVRRLKLEGKAAMDAAAFTAGHRIIGDRLTSD